MSQALLIAQINALNSQTAMPLAAAIAIRFAVTVTTWETRRKTRSSLKRLEAHMLRDIGISDYAAQQEAAKPFWRA